MRKRAIGTLAVALLFSIAALAGEKGKAVTVKGWVSDTECAAHGDKKCANKRRPQRSGLKRHLCFLNRSSDSISRRRLRVAAFSFGLVVAADQPMSPVN